MFGQKYMNLQSEVRALSSCCLGSYSFFFSLQGLDAICFVAVVLTNNLDAVIEVSKLELLVQLDCELIDFDVRWGSLGEHALHLDRDWSAESHTLGTTESKHNFVFFVVIGDHVGSHCDGHRDRRGGLALDFLFDGNAENVDRKLVSGLFISKGESAPSLPWPSSVVLDFELDELGHARDDLKHLLRLAKTDSTGFLPVVLAVEAAPSFAVAVPVLGNFFAALLHLILELFRVFIGPFAPLSNLALHFLHHLHEGSRAIGEMASTATTTTTATASTFAASATKVLHQLVHELHGVLGSRFLALLFASSFGFLFI